MTSEILHYNHNGKWLSLAELLFSIELFKIKDYLNGKMSLDESISTIQKISRNYAKRQITWFKRESGFQRVCLYADEDTDLILKKILGTISSMKNVI